MEQPITLAMPQSICKIYVHLVYSTKNRERVLPDAIRPSLHDYLGGILRKSGARSVEINSEPDHAHLLFLLGRIVAIGTLVGKLKQGSTLWLREQSPSLRDFHWQNGYASFSVSHSQLESAQNYVRNQREHHKRMSFQDELRALLKKHEEEWDEEHLWD